MQMICSFIFHFRKLNTSLTKNHPCIAYDLSITSKSNHLFLPSQIDSFFRLCQRNNLVLVSDLFIGNNFTIYENIFNSNTIHKLHFSQYLQVRSVFKKAFSILSSYSKNTFQSSTLSPLHGLTTKQQT